jgi:hypothetical protein
MMIRRGHIDPARLDGLVMACMCAGQRSGSRQEVWKNAPVRADVKDDDDCRREILGTTLS